MFYKSILLLDDDDDDCSLFQDALHEVDNTAELKTTNSCHQLMTMLRQPDGNLPDLIVMDLNMPEQNGFECLASLKVTHELKHIPVIIFSTSAQREAIDLVYSRGAMHYITKPSAFGALKQIVSRLLTIDLSKANHPLPREKFLLEF
jgi:CheY-like chemotaxis protein